MHVMHTRTASNLMFSEHLLLCLRPPSRCARTMVARRIHAARALSAIGSDALWRTLTTAVLAPADAVQQTSPLAVLQQPEQ